jgi:hypothetical protein
MHTAPAGYWVPTAAQPDSSPAAHHNETVIPEAKPEKHIIVDDTARQAQSVFRAINMTFQSSQ